MLCAAQCLKDAQVPFSLLPTIHRKNFREIDSFLKLAQKIDVPIAFSLLTCNSYELDLHDYVLSEHDFLEFIRTNSVNEDIHIDESSIHVEDIVFKSTCGAGKRTLSIDSMGRVFLCHMLHAEAFYMGNILTDSWSSILASKNIAGLVAHDVDGIDECRGCEYKYFCGGGCKARTLYAKKTLNSADVYCLGLKESYKKTADYFSGLADNN